MGFSRVLGDSRRMLLGVFVCGWFVRRFFYGLGEWENGVVIYRYCESKFGRRMW